jgi:hypothetical protein
MTSETRTAAALERVAAPPSEAACANDGDLGREPTSVDIVRSADCIDTD